MEGGLRFGRILASAAAFGALIVVAGAAFPHRGLAGDESGHSAPLVLAVSGAPSPTRTLPDLAARGLDGGVTHIRSFVGRPLWLNFFATWCPPCNAELPEIERRYLAHKRQGLVVVGLDQQETTREVRRFVTKRHLTFPVVIDDGQAAQSFHVIALPVSVFVNADGTVRQVHIGQMRPADMDAAIASILK